MKSSEFSNKVSFNKERFNVSFVLISGKPTTFTSGRNMVHYPFEISDDIIYKTANFLSLNQRVVSGVSAKNDQILELGTPSALAVWKAE